MSIKLMSNSLALALAVAFAYAPARAETLAGMNVDSRVYVGIEAPAEGVQALMPEGWASVAFPAGAFQGANLLLSLIDGELEMDPEGNPLDPESRRAGALVGLGKKDETIRLFVLRIMTTVPERDPYGVATAAAVERTTSLTGPADGARASSDAWRVMPAEGGELSFTLDYTTGVRSWSAGESIPYSADTPDFSRIYRYDQLSDLVTSRGLGKPPSGTFSFTSTIDSLGGVFDGSQEIVAVVDAPVYVRRVYLQ